MPYSLVLEFFYLVFVAQGGKQVECPEYGNKAKGYYKEYSLGNVGFVYDVVGTDGYEHVHCNKVDDAERNRNKEI